VHVENPLRALYKNYLLFTIHFKVHIIELFWLVIFGNIIQSERSLHILSEMIWFIDRPILYAPYFLFVHWNYVRWWWPSWMEVWVTGYKFESWPFKDHSYHFCFKLAYWFQRKKYLNIFPIGFYVKTISADGGHLGWRSGSQDIILKVDHLRTIHAMFALNWLTGFRGEDF
jgi:hypothetical protein